MKKYIAFLFLFLQLLCANGQNTDFLKNVNCKIKLDQSYGKSDRNKFDIILPNSDTPVPLVIFIHGGGFLYGDKNDFYNRSGDILYFLKNNIAVATINYRFYKTDDSLGVKVCLEDVKEALQYIRHNAAKYNIDKSRIGCYGKSAGAGSSLYLAFHDDMAIPGDTTLLGESTRIKFAGAISTQATYDVFEWQNFMPWLRFVIAFKRNKFYDFAANFYGYKDYKSFKKYRRPVTKGLDMFGMIDKNDPPVYLMNLQKETFPNNIDVIEHHKCHALRVSNLLNKKGVKNYCFTYKKHVIEKEQDIDYPISVFIAEQLK